MCEYTVEIHNSTALTLETIYIRLIGSVCDSKPQVLHTFSLSPVHTSTVYCEESVGTLLLVELEAKPCFEHFLKEWYCDKLVVTTPEKEEVHFPCYQWLDSKKPLVYLRNDKATLVQKETNTALRFQRRQELKERQQNFKWHKYGPGLPYVIYADSASDLANEVKFSFTKNIEMQYNAVRVLVELELESLMACSESWHNFEQLHSILRYPKPRIDYVQKHWKEDDFFGYQILNGLNPMLIERCSELPKHFPVTDDMVKSSLGGSCLKKEMQNGNIFLCDYKRLNMFEGNTINRKKQYLAAPLCLLFSTPDKKLIPIAIQLSQQPSEQNPIFLPTDSHWDWLLAKIFVRNAEFHDHELNFHLLRTHLLAEVFTVATLRNLPSAHPLYKLLKPHTRYTLQINIMARKLLIAPKGIFDKYTSIGQEDAVKTFLPKAVDSLTYSSLCLPENIKERGLEKIPNYYYRDDGLRLWNIIQKFVEGLLKCYYQSRDDVEKDSELQKWISDIFKYGFLGNEKSGIPQSFSNVEEVVKFVTMVIFTVSAQHAAVNNGQFEFGSWMPNLPTSLRLPPPQKKGVVTEETIFKTLPDVTTTIHGMAVLCLLSMKSSDHYPLGQYKEELFSEEVQCRRITEFREDLKRLEADIENRNKSLDPPYIYLQPAFVDNSVAL
ncbi:polyunsaturated fatty acid lipoxygenase ALOX15B-like [Salminus brasiliensis]|uniref:polyunsaturated fatty acid lipoxygenase ALOX15B-like n=1 Tax=Salminus brasiliensis TaxID=930266 RepID=UPI003B831506